MKLKHPILAAALFALTGTAALALTVPIQQDTTATNGKFLPGAGKAATLSVNSKQAAYVQFDLFNTSAVPLSIQPGNIASAILRIYVGKAKVPGDLEIHTVTGSWNEAETGPAPAIDSGVIATIPTAEVATKDFVVIDLTDAIKTVLGGASNNGFAITAAGTTKVTLGSKEGPATGYPCELDIETNYAIDGSDNTTVNTLTAGTVNGGQFNGSNDFGSFYLFGGFQGTDQNAGTTLMGAFTGTNAGPQIRFQNSGTLDGTFTDIGQDANENFVVQSNDNAQLTVTKNGNVGIGTSTPKHKLDVNGNLWFGTEQEGADFTELGDTLYIGSSRKYLSNTLGVQVNGNTDWVNLMAHPLSAGILFGLSGPSDTDPHSAPTPLMAVQSDGNVGIGTGNSAAAAKLDVRGDVKLGSSGQYFATGGQENLRIVRGFVNGNATAGIGGSTFTVARTQGAPTGDYTITYAQPFGDTAIVALSPFTGGAVNITYSLVTETSTTFRVQFFSVGNPADEAFTFIAAGLK